MRSGGCRDYGVIRPSRTRCGGGTRRARSRDPLGGCLQSVGFGGQTGLLGVWCRGSAHPISLYEQGSRLGSLLSKTRRLLGANGTSGEDPIDGDPPARGRPVRRRLLSRSEGPRMLGIMRVVRADHAGPGIDVPDHEGPGFEVIGPLVGEPSSAASPYVSLRTSTAKVGGPRGIASRWPGTVRSNTTRPARTIRGRRRAWGRRSPCCPCRPRLAPYLRRGYPGS